MLAALIMLSAGKQTPSAEKVEQLAREMGMVYPQETVGFEEEASAQ